MHVPGRIQLAGRDPAHRSHNIAVSYIANGRDLQLHCEAEAPWQPKPDIGTIGTIKSIAHNSPSMSVHFPAKVLGLAWALSAVS